MVDVSKLARARMAKAPVAGPHPDADLLTAFAERSTTPAEREQVLAHLATCAECREVVTLASPEAVPLEQPVLVPRRSRWLPAGVFRWGTMAAAVAVVAVVVLIESPKYQQEAAPLRNARSAASQPADAAFASADQGKLKASTPAPQAEPKAAPTQSADFRYQAGPLKKDLGTVGNDKLAKAEALPAPAAPPGEVAPAKQAETLAAGKVAGSGGGLVHPTVTTVDTTVSAEAAAVPQATVPSAQPAANVATARSAPAPAAKAAPSEERAEYDSFSGGAAGSGMAINGAVNGRVRGIAYRWTVTSDGRVQRSADGRTWMYMAIDPKTRIRALASDGDEVWAGGERAALYHSTDAGESWNKVPLGQVQGDIIRIVINGSTLQISTSAGQTISMSPGNASETPAGKPPSPR